MMNFDWSDWTDWVLAGLLATLAALVLALVVMLGAWARDFYLESKWVESCPGSSYQTLVVKLGTPTDREAFEDGTEVVCWKKYHEETTTWVMCGKTMMPIHNPAHTSGWKAIMRRGVCVKMEAL